MATPSSKFTRSPAFQFYPKDFLSSSKVQQMSLAEIGAYLKLLCHNWLDGSLLDDVAVLARIVGMKQAQFAKMWAGPLHECFETRNGRLVNQRLEKERKAQADFRKKQKDKADTRWHNQRNTDNGNAVALPERHEHGNALRSAICNLQSASTQKPKEQVSEDSSATLRDAKLPSDSTPVVLVFPTVGKGLKTWELHESDVSHWRELFPNLDVVAECRSALAWVEANRPKTAKGMPAFLVNWFNRAVAHGGGRAVPVASSKTAGNVEALRAFVARGQA